MVIKFGWWLTYPSEKWWSESQLGLWNPQLNGKTKKIRKHQPESILETHWFQYQHTAAFHVFHGKHWRTNERTVGPRFLACWLLGIHSLPSDSQFARGRAMLGSSPEETLNRFVAVKFSQTSIHCKGFWNWNFFAALRTRFNQNLDHSKISTWKNVSVLLVELRNVPTHEKQCLLRNHSKILHIYGRSKFKTRPQMLFIVVHSYVLTNHFFGYLIFLLACSTACSGNIFEFPKLGWPGGFQNLVNLATRKGRYPLVT